YWLRKTKLDELPQLINVVLGEMTLVGPRPEVPRYVAMYNAEQCRVLDLVPGIVDPASIKYCNESEILARSRDPELMYIEKTMPEKIWLNLSYAEKATIWSDTRVIISAFFHISIKAFQKSGHHDESC
ncbi:MAG: sugar transferase, partial [Firmicutes bacterium]|nr:sugar transferase [Bacillota bacterium]